MTPEDVLADLRDRRSRLPLLAARRGDPLDLAAALLPGIDEADIAGAARGVAADPARVALLADVHGAQGLERVRRLAFVAALAHTARFLDDPTPWRDLVDDAHHDLLGRPHAWRDLSPAALSMELVLELPDSSPARQLLHLAARAALDAPPREALDRTLRIVTRARLAARVQRWKAWLEARAASIAPPLRDALDALVTGAVPMAAADGPPDALARVVVGEALGGEVTLAVGPTGLLLEWDGDSPPPDDARLGDRSLEPSPLSLAARAWSLDLPPSEALVVELAGPGGRARIAWGQA